MLILKERVLYEGCKLYIEFTHRADIIIYSLVLETVTGENVMLYACDTKKVIDFIFDAVIAELNGSNNRVVDVNYIISNACE
ncbi:hypothetical protein QTL86_17625 [Cellulosilyticum sp. ST5]|uniref:Uncharacterized protein n=1 Tax=Cellulosilyticum lentocellum (strain ATCC 49066 / DSM 5427 / NCIMB 11756 / RHM5) TaxID=642492 RepID=F2JH43_CELLD|nr:MULTISPECIES: hypothetical protein [Cellulosilyticum]ADZ81858.1 hypothetical protein Clole_0098 [Cellulosilyticum lentocellum DSM 5427]QEH67527.1 hypothetical protein EKH84_03515 [Cellulosilyticum sp. WCF-2]